MLLHLLTGTNGIHRHRIVSKQGYIDNPLIADKLIKEGFELEAPKGKRGHKVKDYKNHLFHYETEKDLDAEFIMRIQNEGIEQFVPLNWNE